MALYRGIFEIRRAGARLGRGAARLSLSTFAGTEKRADGRIGSKDAVSVGKFLKLGVRLGCEARERRTRLSLLVFAGTKKRVDGRSGRKGAALAGKILNNACGAGARLGGGAARLGFCARGDGKES